VSPKSTAFVDRSVVFYLGMDSDWDQKVSKDPWIDREIEEKKNLEQFLTLIQNGSQIHYMVQDKVMNQEVTPSSYLAEVCDFDFSCFTELPHGKYGTSSQEKETGFGQRGLSLNSEQEEVTTISQSSLNELVKCPKDYFFSRLIDQEQRSYFKRGPCTMILRNSIITIEILLRKKGEKALFSYLLRKWSPLKLMKHCLSLNQR